MKDFYDLWAIPKTQSISDDDLLNAISSTFQRRQTAIPTERPKGLSDIFTTDQNKSRQWAAYAESIDLDSVALKQVADEVWTYLKPICKASNI